MVAAKRKEKSSKIIWTSTVSPAPGSVALKFRPARETPKEATRGKLPCAEAASVQQVILMMVVHLCRKVMYGIDVSYRVCAYVLGTMMLSVVGDYKSGAASRSFLANKDNLLNQWGVKLGWGWTLLLVGSFAYLTSVTTSCGRAGVVRNQAVRLGLATAAWLGITSFFAAVEAKSGMCDITKFHRKESCIAHGHNWKGFDISGHCFLLIFSNLVVQEEGKAYLGWERIKDFLRTEEHRRVADEKDRPDTPLTKLKNEEFLHLRAEFPRRTPVVRLLFCLMAVLMICWDFMLLVTVLYFHMMIEKVLAAGTAVLVWFGLYKFLYRQSFSPGLAGEGVFQYVVWRDPAAAARAKHSSRHRPAENKWSSKDEVPKFMGMPLYALKDYKEEKMKEDLTEEEVLSLNSSGGLGGKRSSLASLGQLPVGLARGRQGSISDMRGRARSRSQSRQRLQGGSREGIASRSRNHVNPVHF